MASVETQITQAQNYAASMKEQADSAISDMRADIDNIGFTLVSFSGANLPDAPDIPDTLVAPTLSPVNLELPAKPNTAPDVELAQEAGQVVWIPPSWWHHVRTTGGDTILEGGNSGQGAPVEALHWATTLLPPQHIGDALAALGCVGAVDDYSDEAKTLPHKPSLYSALMAYRIAVQEE